MCAWLAGAAKDAFHLIGSLCSRVWNTTESGKQEFFIFCFFKVSAGPTRQTSTLRPWINE
jgi:hypothetical protein